MGLSIGELSLEFALDMDSVQDALDELTSACNNIGESLLDQSGLNKLSRGAQRVGKDILDTTMDFTSLLARTYAIAGDITSEQADAIRSKALEIGEASSFTATEVAQSMQTLAMAGWKPDAILEGTNALVRMAEVAGTRDIGAVSSVVTTTLSAFGEGADQASRLANILTLTATNTNSTVLTLGQGLSYAANKAGTLGFSMQDTAFTLGIFANKGLQGSRAGTTMVQMLQGLQGTTKKNKDGIAMLTTALGKEFSLFDAATGKARPLMDVYADIRTASKEWTAQQKTEFAQMIGGTRGQNGVLAIMNASAEEWKRLSGLYTETAMNGELATDVAEEMMDTLYGSTVYFQSAMDTLKISIGSTVEEPLKNIVKYATDVVKSLNQMENYQFSGIAKMVAFLAGLGPAVGGIVGAIGALHAIVPLLTAMVSPIGIISLGIAAIGMAALDAENDVGKTLEDAGRKFASIADDLRKKFNALVPEISRRMRNLLPSIAKSIELSVPSVMDFIGEALGNVFELVGNNTGYIANIGRTLIRAVAQGFKKNAPHLIPSIANMLKNVFISSVKSIPTIFSAAGDIFSGLVEGIKNINFAQVGQDIRVGLTTTFKTLVGDKTWSDIGQDLWGMLQTGITTASKGVKDFIGGLLLGDQYKPDDDFKTFGTKIIDKIFDGVDGAQSAAGEFVSGIMESISGLFSDANISGASESLTGIVSRILSKVAETIPKLGTTVSGIITAIGTALFGSKEKNNKGILATGTEALKGLMKEMFTKLNTEIIPSLGTSVAGIFTVIGDMLNGSNASAIDLTGLAKSILTGIKNAIPALGTAIKDVFTAISGLFNAPGSGLDLTGFAQSILTGISDVIVTLGTEAAGVITAISDVLFKKDENGNSLVTAGVSALGTMMETLFTTISTQVIPNLSTAVGSILTAIGGLFTANANGELGDSFGQLASSIILGLSKAIESVALRARGLMTRIGKNGTQDALMKNIQTFAGHIVTAIGAAIPSLTTAATTLIGAIAQLFEPSNFQRVAADATSIVTNLFETIGRSLNTAINNNQLFGDKNIVQTLTTAAGNLASAFFTVMKSAFTINASFATTIFDLIGAIFSEENVNHLVDTITGLFKDATSEDTINTIGGAMNKMWEAIGRLMSSEGALGHLVSGGIELAKGIVGAITQGLTSGAINTQLQTLLQNLGTALQGLFANAGTLIDGAGDIALGIVKAIANGFSEGGSLSTLSEGFGTLAANVISGLSKAAVKIIENIERFIKQGGGISGAAAGIKDNLMTILTSIVGSLEAAIPSMGDALGKLVGTLASKLGDVIANLPRYLSGAMSFGAQLATKIVNSIRTAITSVNGAVAEVDLGGMAIEFIKGMLEIPEHLESDGSVIAFTQAVFGAIGDALGEVASIAGKIVGYLLSPEGLAKIETAGNAIGRIFVTAFEKAIGTAGDIIMRFGQGMLVQMGILTQEQVDAYWSAQDAQRTAENTYTEYKNAIQGYMDSHEIEITPPQFASMFTPAYSYENFSLLGPAQQTKFEWTLTNYLDAMQASYKRVLDKHGPMSDLDIKSALGEWLSGIGITQEQIDAVGGWDWIKLGEAFAKSTEQGTALLWEMFFKSAEQSASKSAEENESVIDGVLAEYGLHATETASEAFGQLSEEAKAGVVAGILSGSSEIDQAMMEAVAPAVQEAMSTMSAADGASIGSNFASGIANGIRSGIGQIIAAARAAALAGKSAFEMTLGIHSPSAVMAESGGYFDSGVVQGILGGIRGIYNAAVGAAKGAESGFNDYMGINSPSVRGQESGAFYDSGIRIGIEKGAEDVIRAAAGMAEEVNDGITETWSDRDTGDSIASATEEIMNGVGEKAEEALSPLEKIKKQLFGDGAIIEEVSNDLKVKKPPRKGTSGNTGNNDNRQYNDTTSVNVQTVKVQGMDDIQALAAEIVGAKRRMSFGYGTR